MPWCWAGELLAYECEFTLAEGHGTEHFLSLEFANWRDEEEARHLVEHLSALPPEALLLVWCGHSHQGKTPQHWRAGGNWAAWANAWASRASTRLSSTRA